MLTVLLVLVGLVLLLSQWNQPRRVFPAATIQRIVESIVQQSEYIATMDSPQHALIHSRECQASLATLLRLVGGSGPTVDAICAIDTRHLQNILYFQEKQIRAFLPFENS